MKRLLFLLSLTLLVLPVRVYPTGQAEAEATPAASGTSSQRDDPGADTIAVFPTGELPDLGGRIITAGVANDTAPFSTVDLFTGEAVGFDYDLAAEIARRLNLRITWRYLSRDALAGAITAHRVEFGMGAVALTAETVAAGGDGGMVASRPYLVRQQRVLLRADGRRYDSVAGLAADGNAVIGVAAGTPAFYVAAYDLLRGVDETRRISLYSSTVHAVAGLRAGEVDAVVLDGAAVGSLLGAGDATIVVMDEPLAPEAYVIVFPAGSDLLGSFNAAIAAMGEDGFIAEREAHWFYERAVVRR
jgi:polar amino acid transport system substrate-binding protein